MQINVIYDQSQGSLPSGFVAAVNYVVNYFDTTFINSVTVNIDLGYGEIAGQSLGSNALGESETFFSSVAYDTAVNALKANEPSATQQAAYATLPGSNPLSGGTLWLATAQEKALGLLAPNNSAIDGYVGVSNFYPFSYSPTATPASNQYYFVGVLAHEFSEVLGRVSLLGQGLGGTNSDTIMDLFRYAAAGTRQVGTGGAAYFSIDNGATNLDSWNTNPSGDLGDWASSAGFDSFLAFSPSGQTNWITQPDLTLMNVLGWDMTPAPVVTATNQTVAYNQSVPLTSMFSVSGTGVTQYQIWFSYAEGGAPPLGTLTNNGTPIATDQWVTVTSLSGLVYTGPSVQGTDKIWLKAFNGAWSNAPEADITDQGIPAPTVTGHNQAATPNQAIPLTSLFSVSGSGITQYQLWFSYPQGGAPALGTVTNNGTPIALDQWVTLTSLSGLVYTGSSAAGTDKMWLRAYNGSLSSAEADIIDQGSGPPTITSSNQTVAYNQSVPVTSLFSVSGSGVTQYQIWFSYPEGGSPALGTLTNNSTPIAQDQWVTLTSLSGLTYTGSSTHGTDKMWLKAFNGSWSNWSEADISDPGTGAISIAGSNQTVAYNQTVSLTNIFSVSGIGITQYQLWFGYPEGGSPALGTVSNNGTPIAQDQWVTLTSLSGVTYAGSTTAGTDKLWLKAFNGTWSNWTEADITDPGHTGSAAPILVSGNNSAPITINAGDTIEVDFPYSGTATFTGADGTLRLDASSTFSGTVAGLGGQDTIDLADINFASLHAPSYSGNASGGTLDVTDGAHIANIALLGNYIASSFVSVSDGHGGTSISGAPAGGSDQHTLISPPQHG